MARAPGHLTYRRNGEYTPGSEPFAQVALQEPERQVVLPKNGDRHPEHLQGNRKK